MKVQARERGTLDLREGPFAQAGTVQVLGGIWAPYGAECAMEYPVPPNLFPTLTREAVESYVHRIAGDFSSVTDFRMEVRGEVIEWADEENEWKWCDAMYGSEGER